MLSAAVKELSELSAHAGEAFNPKSVESGFRLKSSRIRACPKIMSFEGFAPPATWFRMRLLWLIAGGLLGAGLLPIALADVRINEVMASNGTTISDEDGDFEDWVELLNISDFAVDVSGWGLSDDFARPFRWTFPEGTRIGPGEFLLIWASGKDRRVVDGPLHTNFSISREGEPILLTRPDGVRQDFLEPRPIPRDVSVGRLPSGGDEWYYFIEPSPLEPNRGEAFDSLLSPPSFSHVGGFFQTPFTLTLSHPDPGVNIIYTIDGSSPRRNRLEGVVYGFKNAYPADQGDRQLQPMLFASFGSRLYSSPIAIFDRSAGPNRLAGINTMFTYEPILPQGEVFKGTVIRAKAVRDGAVPSEVVTHTYFVHPEILTRYSLPVISLSLDEDDFIGYERGIYVPGKIADAWKFFLGEEPWFWWYPTNYNQRGREWERAAHLEVFDPLTPSTFSQDIGIRIHGGRTRAYRIKSLRLHARSSYGAETMDFPIFPDLERRGSSGLPLQSFRRLIIRNAGNDLDKAYFRDAFMQKLVRHLGLDGQAYRPAIHFINGEYWGLINFRERLDAHYLESHYGLDPEDVVILSDWLSEVAHGYPEDREAFLDIIDFAETSDLSLGENLEWIADQVDLDNLISYYAVQVYVNNRDWPQRNNDFWKKRGRTPDGTTLPGHDGRWRWLIYDLDFGFGWFGDHTVNSLERVIHLPDTAYQIEHLRATGVNRLFRALVLENREFRNHFINTLADLMNSAFEPRRVLDLLDEFEATIGPYRDEHNRRWDESTGPQESMYTFAAERPEEMRRHVREVFRLPGLTELTVTANDGQGIIRVNSLNIDGDLPGIYPAHGVYPWTGVYFRGVPFTLEAKPKEGYRFMHWRILGGDGLSWNENALIDPSPLIQLDPRTAAVWAEAFFEPLPPWMKAEVVHKWEFESPATLFLPLSIIAGGSLQVASQPHTQIRWNAAAQDFNSGHLRVNNPLGSSLIFQIPTAGTEDIRITYETRRSANGAALQRVQISTDGQNWTEFDAYSVFNAPPQRRVLDLRDFPDSADNSHLAIRIQFEMGTGGDAGNNRFDNFIVSGRTIRPVSIFGELPGSIDLGWHWKRTERGIFRDIDYPWVYSATGEKWLWVESIDAGNFLFWSPLTGDWYWSNTLAWPHLYRFQKNGSGGWLLH